MKEEAFINLVKSVINHINPSNEEELLTGIEILITNVEDISNNTIDKNFLFVYGSLRKDQFNYNRLRKIYGKKNIQYLFTCKSDYLRLYDLGNYPAVIEKGTSFSDFIIGDLLYISEDVSKFIKDMEEEAGYTASSTMLWFRDERERPKAKRFTIYTAGGSLAKQIEDNKIKYPQILNGDWIKYYDGCSPIIELKVETEAEKNDRIQRAYNDYYGDYYC